MATEPIQGLHYPAASDSPNGPDQFKALVDDVAGRTVMRFASTTTRDAALPAPVDGQLCTTGSGATQVLWYRRSGAWLDVTQKWLDPWTTNTPTLLNVTLGSTGTLVSRFSQVGKTIDFSTVITLGTGGALTGGLGVALPAARQVSTTHDVIGQALIRDASAGAVRVFAVYMPAGVAGTAQVIDPATGTQVNAASPWTWATGDSIALRGRYEAA